MPRQHAAIQKTAQPRDRKSPGLILGNGIDACVQGVRFKCRASCLTRPSMSAAAPEAVARIVLRQSRNGHAGAG